MANQHYRIFPNKVELFKFFGSYAQDLNVGISARLPMNSFAVGTEHKSFRTHVDFFKALAELSGLDVDTKASTLRMGNYIVFFNSPLPNPARRGKPVPAIVGPKGEEVKVEQVKDEDILDADITAILSHAESFNDDTDKKGSKDKLADFAATKSVILQKNKSFENMMADFKAALEETQTAK